MIRNRFVIKVVSVFLLLNFLQFTFLPTVLWALTAGPTAPEATSFEPVDTTDMVNLSSGDFSYTIPLLEVPGPAGGYPLALSYHAGIKPNEDASWVGLGWSLNPGAINRFVNGYADDQKAATVTDHVFWEGGTTTTFSLGVSVGAGASVGAGLEFSYDTYQGFGMGGHLSYGLGLSKELEFLGIDGATGGVGLGGSIGVSPYGETYSSFGVSASASIPFADNLGLRPSASYGPSGFRSSVGLSLLSKDDPTDIKGTGNIGVNNSKVGKVSTDTKSIGASIPLGVATISLGFSKTRYWIDEKENVNVYGVLHQATSLTDFDNLAFDNYDLNYNSITVDNPDPTKRLGGTFNNPDSYLVQAQGLSGSIKPYLFQSNLNRQNVLTETSEETYYETKHYSLGAPQSQVEFRFVNDFSNTLETNLNDFTVQPGSTPLTNSWNAPDAGLLPGDGSYQDNHLAGSKHIEWYTNQQIVNGVAQAEGFVDVQDSGFNRSLAPADQIGGFMITNSSGVTYHYALPAYSYNEFTKSETIDDTNGDSFHSLTRSEKYAYTWFLTSITGSDYVDRNNNQALDDADWGYWVDFNYGLWDDDYKWRNPAEDFRIDIENNVHSYSRGQKELYYLDAISTATHTAIFFKEERPDGRGVADLDAGGFDATSATTLRLQEIALIKKNNLHQILGVSSRSQALDVLRGSQLTNVVDGADFSELSTNYPSFPDQVMRAAQFDHDYSLCLNTANSFYDVAKKGKLTLNSLRTLGLGYTSLIPPTKFDYGVSTGNNPDYNEDAHDLWQMYKSDHVETAIKISETYLRMPTETSSTHVDAWSLQSIETPLGATIEIDYESDSYSKSVLDNKHPFKVLAFKKLDGYSDRVRIHLVTHGVIDIDEYFELGEYVDLISVVREHDCNPPNCDPNTATWEVISNVSTPTEQKGVIIEATNNSLTVQGQYFYDMLYEGLVYPREPIGGNLSKAAGGETLGGGLRVAAIRIDDSFTGVINETTYNYDTPGSQTTSGVTSYEPTEFSDFIKYELPFEVEHEFHGLVSSYNANILTIASELPPPGVIYEYVTVQDRVHHPNGATEIMPLSTEFHFQPFERGLVNREVDLNTGHNQSGTVGSGTDPIDDYDNIITAKVFLKNFTPVMGSLLSTTIRDKLGNKVSETINHYLHQGIDFQSDPDAYVTLLESKFGSQGVVEESFADARLIRRSDTWHELLGVQSKRQEYPVVQTGVTSKNYKTGVSNTSTTLAFDFFSGQPTHTLSSDSYGNYYITESLPAYQARALDGSKAYSGMGLKVSNLYHKNMLTQQAGQLTYKVTSDTDHTPVGLVSYSVQTWNDLWEYRTFTGGAYANTLETDSTRRIWRQHRTFNYTADESSQNPDGTANYNDLTLDNFTWWTKDLAPDESLSSWQKNGEVTLYDHYSHALEAQDINGNLAATKMNNLHNLVLSTAANAGYNEMVFGGAEEAKDGNGYFSGELHAGVGSVNTSRAHTGSSSLLVSGIGDGFNYKGYAPEAKIYRTSVWIHETNFANAELYAELDGVPIISQSAAGSQKSGEWHLVNMNLTASGPGVLEVGCRNTSAGSIYMDDFRLHPVDAALSSYVYHPITDELTYILDQNNLYTRFDYDEMGRLKATHKEIFQYGGGEKQVSNLQYNYARNNSRLTSAGICADGNTIYNLCTQEIYDQGNCTVLDRGSSVIFTVTPDPLESQLNCAQYSYQWEQRDLLNGGDWSSIGSDQAIQTVNFNQDGVTEIRCQVVDQCNNQVSSPSIVVVRIKDTC